MRRFAFLLALLPVILSDPIPICNNGYTLVNNKCLRLFTTPQKHNDAVSTCASYYGTLVTIKNSIDNSVLVSFVGSSIKHFWMGLYCFQSDTSNCLWDDATGSAISYSNFANGFPYTDVGNCVYYSVSGPLAGQWISDDCDDDMRTFVCETPTTLADNCNYNFNGHCYYPSFQYSPYYQLSFEDAETVCENMCGNLVSIHSPNELRFVRSIFGSSQAQDIFIGALTVSSKYHSWNDGSAWDFSNLDTTTGMSGNCMMMALRSNGNISRDAWYPSDCLASRYFLCKRPAGMPCYGPVTTTTVSPVTGSPNPNCNQFIMAPGTFTSPGYPGNYTNNLNCAFSLATLASYQIRLSFNSFLTETCCDKVRIYDGNSADAPLIAQLTGQQATPLYYTSSANRMFVTFTTDGSVVGPGFSANFLALI